MNISSLLQLCMADYIQWNDIISLLLLSFLICMPYPGKSTTLKLITRMLEVDSGSILVDGVNISNVTKESVRSRVAVVPQDNCLFDDTGKWFCFILYFLYLLFRYILRPSSRIKYSNMVYS